MSETSGLPSEEEVSEVILEHFHGPDRIHSTWWLAPNAAARDVLALFKAVVPRIKAEAWDEGRAAGLESACGLITPNPYRADQP